MYLFAIIDVYTRYVVGWSLSNTMTAQWCVAVLREAFECHGCPEIVNSDQGSQFTSADYVELLEDSGVAISMDSRGRALDDIFIERLWRSVKQEGVRLPEPLRNGRRAMARPGRILPLLQRREASPEPWIQDTRKPLSPPKRGGLTQKRQKHYRMRNNVYICNTNPQTKTTLTAPICGSNFGTHYIIQTFESDSLSFSLTTD